MIYVDSMAPTPPELKTQSQIEDEVPKQQPSQQPWTTQIPDEVRQQPSTTQIPDEVPQKPALKPSTNQMPDEVPSSKFNFFKIFSIPRSRSSVEPCSRNKNLDQGGNKNYYVPFY